MHIKVFLPVGALAASLLVAGCVTDPVTGGYNDSGFGEANRMTMMAQVIDPDPQYDTIVPESSADHAVYAIERYRAGTVTQPVSPQTTDVGTSGSK